MTTTHPATTTTAVTSTTAPAMTPPAATTTGAPPATGTAAPPALWNHTLTPTRVGADVVVTVPAGAGRTTFRVNAIQGPFYVYNYTTRTGLRTLSIISSLTPNTTYNYTLEADGEIVGSGTFRTLP
ncbi:MAG: hypothetical protein EOP29_26960 [Rhodococcus sp. (in: high G+C Gram-positive bacteria)]|nr:MAG: hypothetical protein EOP29_26960 [Rhodococcus sp. (in: high G+C Gram-positive bacteria)]